MRINIIQYLRFLKLPVTFLHSRSKYHIPISSKKSPISIPDGVEEIFLSLKLSSSYFIDVLKIILKNFLISPTLQWASITIFQRGTSEMLINENALALTYVDLFPSPANLNFQVIFPLFIKSFQGCSFFLPLSKLKLLESMVTNTLSNPPPLTCSGCCQTLEIKWYPQNVPLSASCLCSVASDSLWTHGP